MTIPGVILAGGQGRRIGGHKAQRMLAGRPLLHHVRDRVEPQVTKLAINAQDAFGPVPLIKDAVPGLGPLGGILAAMTWAETIGAERVLTVAVDTPFLPFDLVEQLASGTGIAIAETQDGLHGTTALWPVHLSQNLAHALDHGTRKVTDWIAGHECSRIRFPDAVPPPFFNVNTAEDLAQAERWLEC